MLEILSSALKRELKIIQCLYKNSGLHPVEELMELTGVTEKTIRADINRINKNFPLLHLERDLKAQIKLETPDNVGFEYVYRRMMELSIEYNFFEYVLIEPNQPITFYTKKLFVSESSIRQLVHKWNRNFERKELDISISTGQVTKIEGDELLIRELYTQYLIEKYGGDFQHTFKKIDSAWELIGHTSKILSIDLPYSNQLKLAYWIFVCIQRMKVGYLIKQRADRHCNDEIAKLLYDKINANVLFYRQFVKDYQVALSVEALVEILGIFDYELHKLGCLSKEISRNNQKEEFLSMKALKDFLISLYSVIHRENLFSEQILTEIYNSMSFQFQIPFFCYNHYGEFKEYVKKENPAFLRMFEVYLEKSDLSNNLKRNDCLKEQLLYYVVIHSKLSLEKLPKLIGQKKLLILTTFHKNYESFLKEKIKSKFAENVNISRYPSNQLQFDIEYIKQFDLIITNYDHTPKELENRILYIDVNGPTELLGKIEEKLT